MYMGVYLCVHVYLATCGGVMTPVTGLTPVTSVSLCVWRADARAVLWITVPSSVITVACWEKR